MIAANQITPLLQGLNINGGGGRTSEIKIRLRPHNSESSFFPYEHLLGTMLHELVHNVQGPHNAVFYKLLDEITEVSSCPLQLLAQAVTMRVVCWPCLCKKHALLAKINCTACNSHDVHAIHIAAFTSRWTGATWCPYQNQLGVCMRIASTSLLRMTVSHVAECRNVKASWLRASQALVQALMPPLWEGWGAGAQYPSTTLLVTNSRVQHSRYAILANCLYSLASCFQHVMTFRAKPFSAAKMHRQGFKSF